MGAFAYLQSATDTSDLSTYTFAAQNLGTAASDRSIIVAIESRLGGGTATISSVTIGGVSASIEVQQTNFATNANVCGLVIASVPTGTTGDVVITFSATMLRCAIQVYQATGLSGNTAIGSISSTSSSPSLPLTVTGAGFAIGAGCTAAATTSVWSELVEDVDSTVESFLTFTSASKEYSTGSSITPDITFGSASNQVGVAAFWSYSTPPPSSGPPALVVSTLGTGNSGGTTTSGIDTTGANLIVISVGYYIGGTAPTISDSKGNTWTALTLRSASANSGNRLYYCENPTVGSGHTFTASGASSYAALAVAAFSGVNVTSSFDTENGGVSSSVVTGQASGSVSPAGDYSLLISGVCQDINATYSVNNSFTIANFQQWVNGVNMGVGLAYKIQTVAASDSITWSATTFSFANMAVSIAVFKGLAPGGRLPRFGFVNHMNPGVV